MASISPLITFKAGLCSSEGLENPLKVKPQPEQGYVYLYSEDDLVHFCWRRRTQSLDEPELDLVMVPTDGCFVPYTSSEASSKTNGRIFVLKFLSSSQRHLFWLQSKPQARDGDPTWMSPRDRTIGTIVHRLLQGEQVNATRELARVDNTDNRGADDDDDDETMDDAPANTRSRADRRASGGAGQDATGGDTREEGEESREGGADGARAVSSSAPDAAAAVRNFLDSLQGQPGPPSGSQNRQGSDISYPHLTHLLPTSITVPMVDAASDDDLDTLLGLLPPAVIVLATGSPEAEDGNAEPSADAVAAAKASLSPVEKRALLKKVLRSPQFHQALGVLTMALRDGGLPSVADALSVKVENGGYFQGSGMPMGGGQAIKAFVDGITKSVTDKE